MIHGRVLVVLAVLTFLPLTTGCPLGRCNRHLEGEACADDGDCDSQRGLKCHPNRKLCAMSCSKGADCNSGGKCVGGVCD